MTNANITIVGLVLDIIGVCLLWRFGLPPDVRRGGESFYTMEQTDENEKKKGRRYDLLAHAAISLIVLGFVLQAVGTGALDSVFSRNPAISQMSSGQTSHAPKAVTPAPTPKP